MTPYRSWDRHDTTVLLISGNKRLYSRLGENVLARTSLMKGLAVERMKPWTFMDTVSVINTVTNPWIGSHQERQVDGDSAIMAIDAGIETATLDLELIKLLK